MIKQKIYVETSVLSYLAARPSRDTVAAGRQIITRQWWSSEREKYSLLVSAAVESRDFLLTWNFRHIANVRIRREVERIRADHGYAKTTICTPEELI